MANQLTDYRRTSYEISEAIAPGWERWRAQFETAVAPVREWLVRELAATPGDTVLELAAGAGDTGFTVAGALGVGGRLISTDFSPAMVAVARRRAAELGVGNVEFRVMDAEDLTLDTGSVDGVLCRFGYMVMVDPAAALSETRRILRPGGRLALAVWDAPDRNPFFTTLATILVKGGQVRPPRPPDPNPFSMAHPDHTKALLEAAGFGTITLAATPVEFRFRDVPGYLGFMADTAGPLAIALRKLSEEDHETIGTALESAFDTYRTDSGYTIPGSALVAVAS